MTSEETISALDADAATQVVYDAIKEEQHWREQLAIHKAKVVELKQHIATVKKEFEAKIKSTRDHINAHINVQLKKVKKRQLDALHIAGGGGQEPGKKRRKVETCATDQEPCETEDYEDYLGYEDEVSMSIG